MYCVYSLILMVMFWSVGLSHHCFYWRWRPRRDGEREQLSAGTRGNYRRRGREAVNSQSQKEIKHCSKCCSAELNGWGYYMCYTDLLGVHESILYVCMSPSRNRFSVLQHFEQDNMLEIHNRKMFNFFPGLLHVHVTNEHYFIAYFNIWICTLITILLVLEEEEGEGGKSNKEGGRSGRRKGWEAGGTRREREGERK